MNIMSTKLSFDEYQKQAHSTAIYPTIGLYEKLTEEEQKESLISDSTDMVNLKVTDVRYIYAALGLVGEAGEVAEKIKKFVRNNKGHYSSEELEELRKELGDVLWYLAELCTFFKMDLSDVANANIYKLQSRIKRDKICSEGDNR